jgi:hypothetical protein
MSNRRSAPTPVLFIGGEGRSGSTILSAVLGNHDGYFPIGEAPDVWQALRTDELCGCGEPFSRCPFWQRVGETAFGGWSAVQPERALEDDARYNRHRQIPRLLAHATSGPEEREYYDRLSRLYRAIKEVSGCEVIVDATKSPAYALVLRRVPHLNLRVLQLIRDSRGVAFSWTKQHIRNFQYSENPALRDRDMATMPPWKSALWWDVKNLLLSMAIPHARRLEVQYERFVADPGRELGRIFDFVEAVDGNDRHTVPHCQPFVSQPFHMVGGNQVRFRRGSIVLRNDAAWQTAMPLSDRSVVAALTFPLLVKYGYVGEAARLAPAEDRRKGG